jgi:Fic-DOC domain mobile mystery protein B
MWNHDHDPGSTPIDPDERENLIPDTITTRKQLNQYEQTNIIAAMEWLSPWRIKRRDPCDDLFVCELHRRMFGEVWKWAGKYRLRDTKPGIDPKLIPPELRQQLEKVKCWRQNKVYEPDEIAVRLHYLTVHIHPFSNGNGRLTRLLADILLQKMGHQPFTWGSKNLQTKGPDRNEYLRAIRLIDMDRDDIGPLLKFARS